jgi:ketosteroid isomerase-like protein
MKLCSAVLFVFALFFSGQAASAPEDDVKALFERFVSAQNAHDVNAVRDLLLDSPNFLWITRGTTIWGRDAAIKRFETYYQGTWRLAPDSSTVKVIMLGDTAAQLYASIIFTTGAPGQPAQDGTTLVNQTLVKTPAGWRVASILPIPLPPPAPAAVK